MDQTEEVNLDEEQEEEDKMDQEPDLDVHAVCVRNKGTIHYFDAPSCQNIFLEVTMSNLFPGNYVKYVSQLLEISRTVSITTLRTTMTGCVSRAR